MKREADRLLHQLQPQVAQLVVEHDRVGWEPTGWSRNVAWAVNRLCRLYRAGGASIGIGPDELAARPMAKTGGVQTGAGNADLINSGYGS
jgi:hypothetical protein